MEIAFVFGLMASILPPFVLLMLVVIDWTRTGRTRAVVALEDQGYLDFFSCGFILCRLLIRPKCITILYHNSPLFIDIFQVMMLFLCSFGFFTQFATFRCQNSRPGFIGENQTLSC